MIFVSFDSIKKEAWQAYRANLKSIMLVQLIVFGVCVFLRLFAQTEKLPAYYMHNALMSGKAIESGTIMLVIFLNITFAIISFVLWFLFMLFNVGVAGFYLNIIKGSEPKVCSVLLYFKENPLKIILALLLKTAYIVGLIFGIIVLPGLFMALITFLMVLAGMNMIVYAVIDALAAAAVILITFVFVMRLFFVKYILADEPNIGIKEAVNRSWEMSKDYVPGFILLMLSFLGIAVLPVIVVFIFTALFFLFLVQELTAGVVIVGTLTFISVVAAAFAYMFVIIPYAQLAFARYFIYMRDDYMYSDSDDYENYEDVEDLPTENAENTEEDSAAEESEEAGTD